MPEVVFTEDGYEKAVLSVIQDLGYQYIDSRELERDDIKNPILTKELEDSIMRINPEINLEVLEIAVRKVSQIDAGILDQRNQEFFEYLQNGIEVSYREDNQTKTTRVSLIDYEKIDNNSFIVTNQFSIAGINQVRRPDIIVFVNGLPLVLVELKTAMGLNADVSNAYRQIRNYQLDIPELFVYNAFSIISDHTHTKAGTITADETWYKEWKTTTGDYEETRFASYQTLFIGMLEKNRFIDLIEKFILFENHEGKTNKILTQYHQYFAVKKAAESTIQAIETGDGRGGVFWHTQGSGKSLSMVFYVKLMMQKLAQSTFVIITDRNDLDDQLYGQFSRVKGFLRQTPIQASSRRHLKELLNERQSNGIFFTTMQKFQESEEPLTQREDVIVITDEAHRSQYGLTEKIGRRGQIQQGMARLVRKSLPKATYIGFTGTPLSQSDKNTQEVFGNYIDVYDMTQSVADGATKPVYYENRVINLGLNEEILNDIDTLYNEMAQKADDMHVEQSKRDMSRLEVLLGSDEAIDALVKDIIEHYEENREDLLTGKAMVVAYNRQVAIKIYQRMLELRPEWQEKVEVVMTGNNNDPEKWKAIVGNKAKRDELARKFKDNDDSMKIAIVVDMWLTGFDVPSLATMYVYKPMKGHNLMQAIARVNRVFKDKEGGLVVDYIGIAKALKEAMSDYTIRDQENYAEADIHETAYPNFQEKLEVCKTEFFHKLDLNILHADGISNVDRADLITNGINHILAYPENIEESFKNEAYYLKQYHSLCSSLSTKKEQREASYIEAVRIGLNRLAGSQKLSKTEMNEQISDLIEHSIHSEGIINLFSDFKMEFSLFDQEFLNNVSNMEQKNLSIELLSKLLKDEIKAVSKYDIVQGGEFSQRFRDIIKRYREQQLGNAESLDEFMEIYNNKDGYGPSDYQETIDSLVNLANDMVKESESDYLSDLSRQEKAFYNALSQPENISDFYTNSELIQLTQDLTEAIKKETGTDWMLRESGKAKLKRMIKRFLAKHKYPRDEMENIINLTMKQAENWTAI